jgi:LmbE family N-acetylglucosaminyl deacetylase
MNAHDFPERKLIPYEASRFQARRVLVLAPHADDEVFGCGGALADLIEQGAVVRVLILTDGAGDEQDPGLRRRIDDERSAESRRALQELGGGEVVTVGLPDRGLENRLRKVNETLEEALVDFSPDLIFVPSPAEIHPDHRALSEAFLDLARGSASAAVSSALAAATVAFYELSQPIRPNFLFDATRVLSRKERAVACFASQLADRDYPAFVAGLGAYRRMTLPKDVRSAEGFYVVPARDLRTGARDLRERIGPAVPGVGRNGRPPLSFIERLRVLVTGRLSE